MLVMVMIMRLLVRMMMTITTMYLVPSMGVQVEGERLVSTLLINNAVEVIIKDHNMMMVITDQ